MHVSVNWVKGLKLFLKFRKRCIFKNFCFLSSDKESLYIEIPKFLNNKVIAQNVNYKMDMKNGQSRIFRNEDRCFINRCFMGHIKAKCFIGSTKGKCFKNHLQNWGLFASCYCCGNRHDGFRSYGYFFFWWIISIGKIKMQGSV